ncbi:FAD-dependent oxidoreductase [Mesorhizobium sp. DCY119]|uniref:FAD-dependent oxidoreductase n=1 Tax=Mesorhizobium sp. DCY119 TaxID=2108445 RepID=UPI001A8FCB77|nr:FAD-dependent oxidoreductase [Mesorhizobium sp. DCY119]
MISGSEPGRIELRIAQPQARVLTADLCVVGAGAAGVAAAVEAARRGLKVCLLDGFSQIGGQSVNGLIGTFCGFYSKDPKPYQLTYGFAGDMLAALNDVGALSYRAGQGSVIALYDEAVLSAFYARQLLANKVDVVLGAIVRQVVRDGTRIGTLGVETRYGPITVRAGAYVDASGDAALASLAGATVQQPDVPVFGTTMFSVTGLMEPIPARKVIVERLAQVADQYGLDRRDGFVFAFPGRDLCLVNLTHYETPLDPLAMSRRALEAPGRVAEVLAFLRAEFPDAFCKARVAAIGQPGVRQTRGITGLKPLTTAAVRSGQRLSDAIGRCAWPIEFHGTREAVYWEPFPDGHISWVPLSAMIARDIPNLVAAGRCIDAEPLALGAVRVIGPCMAMGAAAAALVAVGGTDFHLASVEAVQALIVDNVERRDPAPEIHGQ